MDKILDKRIIQAGDSEVVEYLTQRSSIQWELSDLMNSDHDQRMIDTFEVLLLKILWYINYLSTDQGQGCFCGKRYHPEEES